MCIRDRAEVAVDRIPAVRARHRAGGDHLLGGRLRRPGGQRKPGTRHQAALALRTESMSLTAAGFAGAPADVWARTVNDTANTPNAISPHRQSVSAPIANTIDSTPRMPSRFSTAMLDGAGTRNCTTTAG